MFVVLLGKKKLCDDDDQSDQNGDFQFFSRIATTAIQF